MKTIEWRQLEIRSRKNYNVTANLLRIQIYMADLIANRLRFQVHIAEHITNRLCSPKCQSEAGPNRV